MRRTVQIPSPTGDDASRVRVDLTLMAPAADLAGLPEILEALAIAAMLQPGRNPVVAAELLQGLAEALRVQDGIAGALPGQTH